MKWFGLLWEAISPSLPALTTSFFSVLVGALPFMVIAAFASAILEVFVSKDAIARLVPKNRLLGVLLAPVLGLVVPMCECGIVPVARRMVQKGVPAGAAITFMLANPILNPLSLYSTYLAFPFAREMIFWRAGLAYLVSVIIGFMIVVGLRRGSDFAILHTDHEVAATAEGVHACDCGHEHGEHHHHNQPFGEKVQAVLDHAASEFFDVSKYFIIGAALAAISQALISREMLEAVGQGPVISVLVMLTFAFLICICSEADAFVAAAFASTFTPGALLAFLVAGPMTDIKNTLMMSSAFKRRFVLFLNVSILTLTALATILLNYTLGWGG
ncbi:MAG: permease [Bacillota bacterium]